MGLLLAKLIINYVDNDHINYTHFDHIAIGISDNYSHSNSHSNSPVKTLPKPPYIKDMPCPQKYSHELITVVRNISSSPITTCN